MRFSFSTRNEMYFFAVFRQVEKDLRTTEDMDVIEKVD